jgi:hypothetical protein
MTDETIIIDGRCVHGKEIRTTVWIRPVGDRWEIRAASKCGKCADQISIRTVNQKPTKVLTTQGRQLTVVFQPSQ